MVAGRVGSGASLEVGCHADGVARRVWHIGCGSQARSAWLAEGMDGEIKEADLWTGLDFAGDGKSAWVEGFYVVSYNIF